MKDNLNMSPLRLATPGYGRRTPYPCRPSPLAEENLSILFIKQGLCQRTKQGQSHRQKVKQLLLQGQCHPPLQCQARPGQASQARPGLAILTAGRLFLNKFKEIFRSDLIIKNFFELLRRMGPRQMVDNLNLFNLGRWLEGWLWGRGWGRGWAPTPTLSPRVRRTSPSFSTLGTSKFLIIPGLAGVVGAGLPDQARPRPRRPQDKLNNWFCFDLIPQIGEEFFPKSLTNTSFVLSFFYKKEKRERVAQYSFILPFILSKIEWGDSIKVEEVGNDMYLSVGLLSLVALSCFYSLMKYIISMYLIQRYKVRDKHPLLTSIVKYYEKTGFIFVILDCIIFSVALLMLCVGGFLFYYLSKFR